MKTDYLRYISIMLFVVIATYFITDYKSKKQFKEDTLENKLQEERFDSLRVAYIVNTDNQINDYVRQNRKISEALKKSNIKLDRVTSVMNHLLIYNNSVVVNTDLSPVLDAINTQRDISYPVKDSTSCLLVKGTVDFVGGQLSLNITERQFFGNTTAIGYWERRQWSFLGFKTRFLGKKQGTVKLIDECGKSKIINISTNPK